MDTKQLVTEFQTTWATMKTALDEAKAEAKKFGEHTGEMETKLKRVEDRMDQLETALKRVPYGQSGGGSAESASAAEAKKRKVDLYFKMLRAGNMDLLSDEEKTAAREYKFVVGPREAKALALGDDTTGGFLAPPEYVTDIIKSVQLISPLRQIANVRTTSRRSVNYPVRSGVFAAAWIGETATRTETTGLTYSMEEVPTFEMYAEVIVSEQDLEDSAFDLQAEITDNCAEQFAKAEGAAFIAGDGVKKPEGIVTSPTNATAPTIAVFTSGQAATIASAAAGSPGQGDGLVKAAYGLKSAYVQGAYWVMNRQSVGSIRRLADSQGRYLWEPNFQQITIGPGQVEANNSYMAGLGTVGGPGATILGIPYIEAPDMPNEAANAYPIMLGNFKRGYLIVDRVDMVVKRLNEKYAEQGQIAFLVRKRVGGQVVLPDAMLKYQCHT